ncbi:Disease resistance protein RPS6 [Glycine soja]|uniref:TIR domain-containing protein n=2 Tax=Glycine subgen. Soja TaxID=1462606 RepID=K7MMQ0_SOYBN|nr:Disease resistance protein RPS6 [Glycine soja]
MTSAVASSSNSFSMLSPKIMMFFLSFRGEDTRRNSTTSHLYEALLHKKIESYIDYQLEKGDEITLIQAIKDSAYLFSFSQRTMLPQSGQIVIPVFYNIYPSHVRKKTGSYDQAFAKHVGEPRCNKWKAALTEAANLAGWDSQTFWTDSELLKDIIGDVLRKLPTRYPNQVKGLVGIEENYKQIGSFVGIFNKPYKIPNEHQNTLRQIIKRF